MFTKRSLLVLFTLAVVYRISQAADTGPIGKLKVLDIKPCDNFDQHPNFDWTASVEDGNNGKFMNLKVNLKQDVDEKMKIALRVDRWDNGDYEENTYNTDGLLFESINKYMPQLYRHIREQAEPKIDDDKFIPAGDYDLKEFYDVENSVNMQAIMYGKFNVYLSLLEGDDEIVCAMLNMDSQRN